MCKLLNKKLSMKIIAVAGTGYVGMSVATLLSQHNEVVAICLSRTIMKRPWWSMTFLSLKPSLTAS